jgi:hypothetical protein
MVFLNEIADIVEALCCLTRGNFVVNFLDMFQKLDVSVGKMRGRRIVSLASFAVTGEVEFPE